MAIRGWNKKVLRINLSKHCRQILSELPEAPDYGIRQARTYLAAMRYVSPDVLRAFSAKDAGLTVRMPGVDLTVTYTFEGLGIREMERNIDASIRRIREESDHALRDWAEQVKRISQYFVPYLTGQLHDAAYVRKVEESSNNIVWVAGYDIEKADYAWIQHEDVTLVHPARRPGKSPSALYLSKAYMQIRDDFARHMRDRIWAGVSGSNRGVSRAGLG